jgi:hypothetical protein
MKTDDPDPEKQEKYAKWRTFLLFARKYATSNPFYPLLRPLSVQIYPKGACL